MKYEATNYNLELELTTLNGETEYLRPKIRLSGKTSIELADKWGNLEDENKRAKESGEGKPWLVINALQLSLLYDKDFEWFLENIDPKTIREIIFDLAQIIAGTRKN